MKKKLIVAGGAVYCAVAVGILTVDQYQRIGNDSGYTTIAEENPVAAEQNGNPDGDGEKTEISFQEISSRLQYADALDSTMYCETDEMVLREEDKISILDYYELPSLERMSAEDAAEKMGNLQVFQKMDVLNVNRNMILYPEYAWKRIYADALQTVDQTALSERESAVFEGTSASELNAFLQENQGKRIEIIEDSIWLDETIIVPSYTWLDGNGAVFSTDENLQYAILMEHTENICIQDVRLMGGFERGIYIVESKNILLYRNEVANADYKAIFVMGSNSGINLVGNSVHDNNYGAVFFEGNISNCIIQHNNIYQNKGARNLGAGLVLSAVNLTDPYLPYEQEYGIDDYLFDMLDSPHDIVIKDNKIQENYSSGIYLDGAYQCHVIDNVIEDNEKEGICLDFGSFGTYVSRNIIARNGDRNRQSDEDLDKDFVLGLGRLSDGSSTAKLPGISIDNGAYNIIYNNIIMGNAGSGVKMVRSGYRNIILVNTITDNNAGENEAFHGFGVELGHAGTPDQAIRGLDFTADYENIVARNMISGHHYSGIFIGSDCYCNDLIDNVIMDCTMFSVENISEYYNSSVGNHTNTPTINFELQ